MPIQPDLTNTKVNDIVDLGLAGKYRRVVGETVYGGQTYPYKYEVVPQTQIPTKNFQFGSGKVSGLDNQINQTPEKTDLEIQTEANQRAMQMYQAQIDATKERYNQEINQFNQGEGARNIAQTNALSAIMGLSGSSSAQSREGSMGQSNKRQEDYIRARQDAELGSIFGKMNQYAYQMAQEGIAKNQEEINKVKEKARTNALNFVTSMAKAKNGLTWDDFKKELPDEAKKVMQQTGKGEYELSNLWEANIDPMYKPKTLTDYKKDTDGTTIETRVIYNPITGAMEKKEFHLDIPYENFNEGERVTTKDGRVIMLYKDGTQKELIGLSPEEKALQQANTAYKNAQTNKLNTNTNTGTFTSAFTKQQTGQMSAAGLDEEIATDIYRMIQEGTDLESIRNGLKSIGRDPVLLDIFDRVVGISKILGQE